MSTFTFKKATSVALVYNGVAYYLDAMSDYEFSQTFTKSTSSRKTLHNKSSRPVSKLSGKNSGSASMTVNASSNKAEQILLYLAGLSAGMSPAEYSLPETLATEPEYFDLFVTTPGKLWRLTKCVATGLSFSLYKGSGILLNVDLAFSNLETVPGVVDDYAFGAESQDDILDSTAPLIVHVQEYGDDTELVDIRAANISFQQEVSWRQDNTIHSIGQVHVPTRAVLTGMPFNGVLTAYEKSNTELAERLTDVSIAIQYGWLKIIILNATLARRMTIEDVFTTQYDITLQDNSSVAVEYGAI